MDINPGDCVLCIEDFSTLKKDTIGFVSKIFSAPPTVILHLANEAYPSRVFVKHQPRIGDVYKRNPLVAGPVGIHVKLVYIGAKDLVFEKPDGSLYTTPKINCRYTLVSRAYSSDQSGDTDDDI